MPIATIYVYSYSAAGEHDVRSGASEMRDGMIHPVTKSLGVEEPSHLHLNGGVSPGGVPHSAADRGRTSWWCLQVG